MQPNCACATDVAPSVAGVPLSPADTPQFIVLTVRGVGGGGLTVCDNRACQERQTRRPPQVPPTRTHAPPPLGAPTAQHDDAVTADTNAAIRSVIDQHNNTNGCNMPATLFVLQTGTNCG